MRQYFRNAFLFLKKTVREDPAVILLHCGTATGLAGFAMTDPLPLRSCSLVSSFSSVIYMMSRPVPMLTPVYWSALFISVNTYKIAEILYCRAGVELSDLEEEVYMRHFVHSGMRPRQFKTLVSHAKTVEYKPGAVVEEEVKFPSVSTVKLLMRGAATVRNKGEEMYTVDAKKPICFLGDLSALQKCHDSNGGGDTKDTEVSDLIPNFVASVFAGSETVFTLEWEQEYIIKTLRSNSELGQRLRTVLTSSLMQKVFNIGINSHNSRYLTLLSAFAVDGELSTLEKKVLGEYVLTHGIDREIHFKGLAAIGWTEEEFQQGHRNCFCDVKWDVMKTKLSGFINENSVDLNLNSPDRELMSPLKLFLKGTDADADADAVPGSVSGTVSVSNFSPSETVDSADKCTTCSNSIESTPPCGPKCPSSSTSTSTLSAPDITVSSSLQ